DQEVLGRTHKGASFEKLRAEKGNTTHRECRRGIRMTAEEIAVVAISHFVAIELPLPFYAAIRSLSCEDRAMKQIALVVGVADNRCPPPIGLTDILIGIVGGQILISM